MGVYEVLLGVDRAARDTGRRMTIRIMGSDPLSAAIQAEAEADCTLGDPTTMYTHAMRVKPLMGSAAGMPVALAA